MYNDIRERLKSYFETGDKPTQEQFAEFISNSLYSIENILYQDLVSLRDNSSLVPGQFYRITDYVTTTSQENTKSAGHQFDVIVLALTNDTLAERAWACHSEFDIEKYKDAFSGSWGEHMLYVGIHEYEGKEYHLYESESQDLQMLVDFNQIKAHDNNQSDPYPYYCYPSFIREYDGEFWDGWQFGPDYGEMIQFKYDTPTYFATSRLEAWQIWYSLDNDAERFAWADATNGKGVIYRMIDEHNNDCPYDFKNIMFKREDIWKYTFSLRDVYKSLNKWTRCCLNTIKPWFNSSVRKYQLNNNVFLDNTSLEDSSPNDVPCVGNSLAENCFNNTFGANVVWNTIGAYSDNNTFGNAVKHNTTLSRFSNNTLGDEIHHNSFGTHVKNNTLGSYIYHCQFGNGCISNLLAGYSKNIIFENGVYSVRLTAAGAGEDNYLQNYTISSGLNEGGSTSCRPSVTRKNSYNSIVSKGTNGTVRVFCLADLADA